MDYVRSLLRRRRSFSVKSEIFEGTLAICSGAFLGLVLVLFPPKAWVVLCAGGTLLLFPFQPGKFLLGYLIISPILDQLAYVFGSGLPIEPQILFRGGLTVILVYYWLAAQRNPLLVKAALPSFILLAVLTLSMIGSGAINAKGISDLAKLMFWMLLLPTVADMVAHKVVRLNTIYRCLVISLMVMTASVLVASFFGITKFSRYGVGEMSGFFTPHALAISLSIGLIVTLALATIQQNKLHMWALLFFSAIIVYSIAKTYVRTGWTACIVMLAALNLFFWRYGKGEYSSGWKRLIWGQAIIAVTIVVYVFANLEGLVERNSDFYGDTASMGSGRIVYYTYFVKVYADYPIMKKIIGGSFSETLMEAAYRTYDTHSDYLNILMAGGVVGLSLHLWLFISLWKQVKSTSQDDSLPLIIAGCAIATYLVAAMTNGVWYYMSVMTYFSFLVGGAIGYYQLLSSEGKS